MCTIAIEALTPLKGASRIKKYKILARSRLFCSVAKKAISSCSLQPFQLSDLVIELIENCTKRVKKRGVFDGP